MHSWQVLSLEDQLSSLKAASYKRPQLIFKHSIRCGISSGVRRRLESATDKLLEKMDLHYLDLITYRQLSNLIAEEMQVHHQSPQVILLQDGEILYHASHYSIEAGKILEAVETVDGRR